MGNLDMAAAKGKFTTATGRTGKGGNDRVPLLAWPWLIAALTLLLAATVLAWWQDPLPVPPNRGAQGWSFWKPMEVNAHRRLPAVDADLYGVSSNSDGLRGWVVGGYGTIVATDDGGKTWSAQTNGIKQWLNALSFNADGLRGWAVGVDGVIVSTTDGGKTWSAQVSGTPRTLNALSFNADGLRGWAVGRGGVIVVTIDGGTNWLTYTSGSLEELNALSFNTDGLRGWAVGSGGTIIATSDGGKTWSAQTGATQLMLRGLSFNADGLRGWAAGADGTIVATVDGGKTWSTQTSGTQLMLNALSFTANGLRGWAMGLSGTIITTTDGGKTWSARVSYGGHWLTAMSFNADGRRGWAVGLGGAILSTTDGGITWSPQTSGSWEWLNALSLNADGLRGWAVGLGGAIVATTDGGVTWLAQASGTQQWLKALTVNADGLRGWAVGLGGAIVATTDGGKTWSAQTIDSGKWLHALSFNADGLRGWASGDHGVIVATIDGGKTWSSQTSGTQQWLRALSFNADGLRGWAAGANGTIVSTVDGGKTWLVQISGSSELLNALSFNADGLRGWAVGGGTTMVSTTDGGKTWLVQDSGSLEFLNALSFNADGLRGWAVGARGTIVATSDSGKTWSGQKSGTWEMFNALSFNADGLRGWAVGVRGANVATTDGGKTWHPAEPYTRYPAPWYALAVLLTAALTWLSWSQRPTGRAGESVADMAASDAEVRQPADDRLEFGGLARGISRFLRNTETRPPLTLAVTGDWGSGKSSLMRLACADMKRFGHQAIWFNAWHHQKQEHLFAALLGAVKAQAVPRLLSLKGVLFRLRLLWLRSQRSFALSLLLVTAIATLVGLSLHAGGVDWFANLTRPLNGAKAGAADAALGWGWLQQVPMIGQWLATLAALLTTAWTLFKATKPFGINPSVLLAEVRDGMSLKTAAAQNDFRAQFAREFNELIQALPNRLVIVIDDLDRCQHSAVLEVMEAVNYLTSAGECFVLFGMATERVQAALGLAFKDIAGEMQQMALHQAQPIVDAATAAAPAPDAALGKRRDYAADYLQKLVNIEIKVPTREHALAHQLLVAPEPAPRRAVMSTWQGLRRLWPVVALVGAVLVGLYLSDVLGGMAAKQAVDAPAAATAPSPSSAVNGTPTVAPPVVPAAGSGVKGQPLAQSQASVEPGASVSAMSMLVWLLVALIPLALVGGFILLRLLRTTVQETRDSPQFRQALTIWTRVVATKRSTPRAIKRFGNRIRYLAMLQQGQDKDETQLDLVRAAVGKWLWRGKAADAVPDAPKPGSLAEHQLIAMGAIYEVMGDRWKEGLRGTLDAFAITDKYGEDHEAMGAGPEFQIFNAKDQHRKDFGVNWPPSEAEQKVFERLLSGVRLGGDPQVLMPTAVEQEKSGNPAPNSIPVSSASSTPSFENNQSPSRDRRSGPGDRRSSSVPK